MKVNETEEGFISLRNDNEKRSNPESQMLKKERKKMKAEAMNENEERQSRKRKWNEVYWR